MAEVRPPDEAEGTTAAISLMFAFSIGYAAHEALPSFLQQCASQSPTPAAVARGTAVASGFADNAQLPRGAETPHRLSPSQRVRRQAVFRREPKGQQEHALPVVRCRRGGCVHVPRAAFRSGKASHVLQYVPWSHQQNSSRLPPPIALRRKGFAAECGSSAGSPAPATRRRQHTNPTTTP